MRKPHNRKYYVFCGIIVFVLLVSLICVFIIMPRGKPLVAIKTEPLYELVQDGDIICRLGDRFWSRMFSDLSMEDKRYSHLGIIRIYNDKITVIHSEGDTGHGRDYVHEEPIKDFLRIARAVGIYRVKNADGSIISKTALDYLGTPFDWKFDISDNSKIYCTELLYVILQCVMPDIQLNKVYVKEMKMDVIPLEAISGSDYFTEIFFSKYSK